MIFNNYFIYNFVKIALNSVFVKDIEILLDVFLDFANKYKMVQNVGILKRESNKTCLLCVDVLLIKVGILRYYGCCSNTFYLFIPLQHKNSSSLSCCWNSFYN